MIPSVVATLVNSVVSFPNPERTQDVRGGHKLSALPHMTPRFTATDTLFARRNRLVRLREEMTTSHCSGRKAQRLDEIHHRLRPSIDDLRRRRERSDCGERKMNSLRRRVHSMGPKTITTSKETIMNGDRDPPIDGKGRLIIKTKGG